LPLCKSTSASAHIRGQDAGEARGVCRNSIQLTSRHPHDNRGWRALCYYCHAAIVRAKQGLLKLQLPQYVNM
jgi:hypothetical protein